MFLFSVHSKKKPIITNDVAPLHKNKLLAVRGTDDDNDDDDDDTVNVDRTCTFNPCSWTLGATLKLVRLTSRRQTLHRCFNNLVSFFVKKVKIDINYNNNK